MVEKSLEKMTMWNNTFFTKFNTPGRVLISHLEDHRKKVGKNIYRDFLFKILFLSIDTK